MRKSYDPLSEILSGYLCTEGVWGGVVVKALRY